jgi:molybdopterin molybdotransferase
LLQENVARSNDSIIPTQTEPPGRHIRRMGLDFRAGTVGLPAGHRLNERSVALAAAMGHGRVYVRRAPRAGILATGDELVLPGALPGPAQIVASNHLTTAAIISASGGQPVQLGIAADTLGALDAAIMRARDADLDILVTLGGASVGDHDLVQSALANRGLDLGFWKLAMRPGKPMMFGHLGAMHILGLPGNPVSSFACAKLFLAPMIRAMLGDPQAGADQSEPGLLGLDLPENDQRMDFLRATLTPTTAGASLVPFTIQDSSMISVMAAATALLIRDPFAAAAKAGSACRFIRL